MDSSLHPDVDVLDRPYCHLTDRPVSLDTNLLAQLLGEQSRLYVILVGHPDDIDWEMLNLHHCGYDIDAWSLPQRIPSTVAVIAAYSKPSRRTR